MIQLVLWEDVPGKWYGLEIVKIIFMERMFSKKEIRPEDRERPRQDNYTTESKTFISQYDTRRIHTVWKR